MLASFIGAASVHALESHADNAPAADTPPDPQPNDAIAHDKPADAPAVDHAAANTAPPSLHAAAPEHSSESAFLDPMSSPDSDDGGSIGHVLTSDGSFWFNADDGDSGALFPDDHQSANNFGDVTDAAATSANSSAFLYSASNSIADLDGSHSAHVDAIGGNSASSWIAANGGIAEPTGGTSNASAFSGTAPDLTPLAPASHAPTLVWIGDIGSGATGGSGSAGGASGGTLVQNTTDSSGLVIDVVYDSSVANAPAGFTAAVAAVVSYYESQFTNSVTITIDVGYGEIDGQALGSGALGESETYLTEVSYSQLQAALVKNADAIGDAAAAASLPSSSSVSGEYWVSTAEAEALGLTGSSSAVNGYVGFSSTNAFAYSDSNGVPANQYDFYGVVAHEISEVMGRQMMDGESFNGSAGYEPLDLFHYSASGVRDFSGTTAGYASPDGGKTNLDNFNTNPDGDFGDWAASAGNDSYNAFSYPGVVNAVSASDLAVMNLLGWDSASSSGTPPAGTPAVTMHLTQDTGSSPTDKITSNDSLTGNADADAVVTFTSGTQTLGTTMANSSGVWSFTPTGLADGSYTIVASETNSAGKTGTASLSFTLDTTAPTVTSDVVSGTGISGGSGTLTPGHAAVLTLGMSESVVISGGAPTLTLNDGGTATYDAAHSTATSLAFDYTVVAGQTTNALAVTQFNFNGATVTDLAGNAANAANVAGADTTFAHLAVAANPTPVVTIALSHDTGLSSTDDITSNDALTGTADPSAVITFTSAGKTLGTATANKSGVWSYTPKGLPNGQDTIVASETNSFGNTGIASLTFTLDTIAPTVVSETVSGAGIATNAGTLNAGEVAVITLGMSEAVTVSGGVPTLTLNDGATATYDAAHSTAQSLAFDYTVGAGQYVSALAVKSVNLSGATVADAAGNATNFAGAKTTFANLLVDATTPVAKADETHVALNGSVSANHAHGVLANDTDSDAADVLSVSAVNGSAAGVGHAVAGTFGTLTLNSDGSYSYANTDTADVTAAGGVAEDSFNYTVSNGHGGTANATLDIAITSPGETYVGGASGSTIKGSAAATVLDGSAGNMHVNAGSGTQWLIGGPGDTLSAGSGSDTFIFAPNLGNETIQNFNTAHDVIELPQSVAANFAAVEADIHASGANTVIALDAHDAITLSSIAVQNLTAQNFHFIV